MLKINSLLNPATEHDRYGFASSVTPPSTPANSPQTFSVPSTSQPNTPITSTPKRQKRAKDGLAFVPGSIRGPVNYPPFECAEHSVCLNSSQKRELEEQHRLFKLEPHGEEAGLISKNVQHIPYSSDKRGFLDKTGRGGFDVFRYSFTILMEEEKNGRKEWRERTFIVMWDYQVGLVRITPFFKACKYTKTTPNKALSANPGLKDLSHSVTGGSVEAQGYWVPYSCARAICITFCYKIRWALTPIFGPSFIKECLHPGNAGYGRFKINPDFVRNSALEQEGWKAGVPSRPDTPIYPQSAREIPRSAPEHVEASQQKPEFKQGSPFSNASSDRNYVYSSPATESPALSPKSRHRAVIPAQSPSWTSINRSGYDSPMSSPPTPLSGSLLTKPRFSPNVSWRAAEPEPAQTSGPSTRMSVRRSAASAPKADADYSPNTSSSSMDGESSDEPVQKKRKTSKSTASTYRSSHSVQHKSKKNLPSQWTEEDMKAARWLLSIHDQPRNYKPSSGLKRKGDGH